MNGIGDLVAHLSVDSREWGPRFDKARTDVKTFSSSVGSALSALGPAAAAVAVAFMSITTAIKSIQASGESLASSRKLDAVLEATGNAAKLTREEYDELAASIQQTTNFDDDGATNAIALLARFAKVEGAEFRRVIPLAADLAAVIGGDLSSATETLGRALAMGEDGLSKIRKAGVILSDQQIEQIKTMYEWGDAAKAQSLVLDAVERSIGGTAERMADPFIQLENSVGDIFESLGMNIRAFAEGVFEGGLIEGVDNLAEAIASLEPVARELGKDAVPVIQQLVEGTRQFAEAMQSVGEKAEIAAKVIRSMHDPVGELADSLGVSPFEGDAGIFSALPRGNGPAADTSFATEPIKKLFDILGDAAKGQIGPPERENQVDNNPFAILDMLPEKIVQETLDFGLDDIYRAGGSDTRQPPPTRYAGAALEGSVEAYRTAVNSMGFAADSEQKEHTKLLRSIDTNLKQKSIHQLEVVEAVA